MSHFALINEENIVKNIIVVEQDFIDTGLLGDPSKWIKTSYNTREGIHYSPETNLPDDGNPLRKNFAQPGMIYDPIGDGFYWPKPGDRPSFVFNEDKYIWEPPIAYPQDGKIYNWNESLVSWVESDIKI